MNDVERLGHRPGLDGLRGVAVLLVFAAHLELPGFSSGGLTGVTLFFGLSGFLICTILLDELHDRGAIRFGRFYMRRALRLVPALVVVVAFWSWWDWAAGRGEVGRHAFVALTYLSDFERAAGGDVGSLRHTWSLAIEEQFYLLWPLVLGLVGVRRLRWLAVGLGVVVALVMWQRTRLAFGGSMAHAEFGIDSRGDAIALGCLTAIAVHRQTVRIPRWLMLTAAAVMAAATIASAGPSTFTLGLTAAAIAAPILVLWAVHVPALGRGVIGWCGRRSYGLYLWHVPITAEVSARIDGLPERAAVSVALTVALVVMSWRLVETPFLRLKSVQDSRTNLRSAVAPALSSRE